MANEKRQIPPSVIRRLTRYLAVAQVLTAQGVEWVSSIELAETLGLTSSTVRQDLSHLDFSGISRRGYKTTGLLNILSNVLGADTSWNLVVVGAGNLGKALALHEEFVRRGFNIAGIFDVDPKKVGKRIGNLVVQHVRLLPSVIAEKKVDMGVIAVPAPVAQSVADLMIASNIKGLLNMALTHIVAPAHVPVIDTRIIASLLELAHAMRTVVRQ